MVLHCLVGLKSGLFDCNMEGIRNPKKKYPRNFLQYNKKIGTTGYLRQLKHLPGFGNSQN